ncbi:unnamed protein product [Prunus armeniaca]
MIAIVVDNICSSSLMLDGRLFHMRCCAYILNLVVRDSLEHREPLYKEVPSETDWAKTNELVDKLAILAIYDWLNSEQEEVQAMTLHMQTKFEKYWDTMHGLMGVASILDPRYRMKQIAFLCPLIYPNNAAQEIKKYKDILYDLVKEYQSKSQQSQQVQSESLIPTSSSRPSMPKLDLVKQLDVFVSHSTTHGHVKSELDHYLEESLLPRNDDDDFDILCWSKSNGIKYLTLHDIARDILAIPVSTVASESCFSTSGRIINPHRSRLH